MEQKQQGLIFGLAGALGCALLAIAFLMGRVTSHPVIAPTAAAPVAANAPAPAAGNAPGEGSVAVPAGGFIPPPAADAPLAAPATRESFAAPAPTLAPVAAETFAPAPPATGGVTKPAGTASNDKQAVATYFAQMESVGDLGSGDPQNFANSLMQSVSSGDFSGFDDLIAKARSQRDRLRGLATPPICGPHHQLALTLAGDSVTMLERLRAALAKNDTSALTSMTTEGHALETQANQLKAMGDVIKRQVGL